MPWASMIGKHLLPGLHRKYDEPSTYVTISEAMQPLEAVEDVSNRQHCSESLERALLD
jgi:hypothetical protein